MKKWFLVLGMVMVLVLVLAGCDSEANDTVHADNNDMNENPVEQNESTNNNMGTNENDDEADEIGDGDSQDPDQPIQEEEVVITEPQYEMTSDWSFKPIGDANEKVVLLTFDDAPDKYALEMAKKLKKLNAPAIFFVNGHFLDTDEEKAILKEIHEMGFEIGNHTYNHKNLGTIDNETQRKEIEELSSLVEEIIGEKPKFFRAPNGTNTDFAKQLVKQEGMLLMNWTYGYDYFKPYMNAEKLKEAMITGKGPEVDVPYSLLKSGANLLMHDREWTNEALEDIVKGLREQGYELLNPKLIKTPTN